MSKDDEIGQRVGPADGPDYTDFHATVVDGIRYGTSGIQPATRAAEEALVRLRSGPRPMSPPAGPREEHLIAAVAAAVERGARKELSTDEAAHAALDALRELDVVIPPRGPDDPFPGLTL